MAAFITLEARGRPAGAPEFLAYSPKQNTQVRLYCRPSFWRWAGLEFNPFATEVLVNQATLNLESKKVSVAIQYEMHGVLHFIFSRREVTENTEAEIIEYCDSCDIKAEFLGAKCLSEEQTYAENLLCMLSYINKYREIFTEKNLEFAFHSIDRSKGTISNSVNDLQARYGEGAAALLFELVRRGRVGLFDVRCKRISGLTQLDVIRVRHE
ncbi:MULTISPECIES: hypothetical protein [Pseudomonadaceae]|jgi:hypothetical protein|uniref:Uncharacterized protein n=1 Tax=Ectopseudomonas composti TaxID=658457 RepID=A0A1I5L470_9GAMM|nr:hypothetical protein [Pseudomonas composti]SFO92120.1 hypothetical protein SAMN05216601_103321 [Pseudomonas composti]